MSMWKLELVLIKFAEMDKSFFAGALKYAKNAGMLSGGRYHKEGKDHT